jgi:signal peptidase II
MFGIGEKTVKKFDWNNVIMPAIAVFVAALDLITKYIAVLTLTLHRPVEFLGTVWRWTYTRNTGITFGMLNNVEGAWKPVILVITALIAVGVVIYFYRNLSKYIKDGEPQVFGRVALMAIIGGAFGNIIDRAYNGFVVDFIDWGLNEQIRWYTFNVGDAFVVCGSITLAVLFLFFEKKTARKSKAESEKSAETDQQKS